MDSTSGLKETLLVLVIVEGIDDIVETVDGALIGESVMSIT